MNSYIKEILEENNEELIIKKIQKTIKNLIKLYTKSHENKHSVEINKNREKNALNDIKEIINYFKNEKINLHYNQDILLRKASLDGETEFIQWLLKEAVCKKTPDLHIQLSAPLRFACLNGHEQLVKFYLTDKDIKRSKINDVYGGALNTVISQKNIKLIKLFMEQPEIDIQIEHIRGIFKLNYEQQQEIINYIGNSEVKEKFLTKMIQYKNEMTEHIKELILDYEYVLTEKMQEDLQYNQVIKDLLYKKNFMYQMEKKLPNKGFRAIIGKI